MLRWSEPAADAAIDKQLVIEHRQGRHEEQYSAQAADEVGVSSFLI